MNRDSSIFLQNTVANLPKYMAPYPKNLQYQFCIVIHTREVPSFESQLRGQFFFPNKVFRDIYQ
jgi:hypothetical protein